MRPTSARFASAPVALILLTVPLGGADRPPQSPDAFFAALNAGVSEPALHATLQALVGFGTRHTLSDTVSDTRGIGAARRWAERRLQTLGAACGGCLEVITPTRTVSGPRIPTPTPVTDVVAVQRGTGDPDRVVLITAHLDSRVSDVMNATSDAPGADDDGSGVAAVLEAARLLSRHRFPATIVYGVLSGEEQGSYGAKILVDEAKARGWRIEADLNNDIIGNVHGQGGETAADRVRVFSEATKANETPEAARNRHHTGGELDSPSRELSRFMAELAGRAVPGLGVEMVYRADRYGRGGDQDSFSEGGSPAVRITEAAENYDRQHQDVRVAGGVRYGDVLDAVDLAYLAKVVRLNVATLAALASAPAPPDRVEITGAVSANTRLSWSPSAGAAAYRVAWRDTTDPQWRQTRDAGDKEAITLKGVNIDDHLFGVSAVSAAGFASPYEFPGPSGAFFPTPTKAAP